MGPKYHNIKIISKLQPFLHVAGPDLLSGPVGDKYAAKGGSFVKAIKKRGGAPLLNCFSGYYFR